MGTPKSQKIRRLEVSLTFIRMLRLFDFSFLFAENGDLGKWAQRQRQVYKNTFVTPHARKNFGQMSQDEREKLDGIGFNFQSE